MIQFQDDTDKAKIILGVAIERRMAMIMSDVRLLAKWIPGDTALDWTTTPKYTVPQTLSKEMGLH
jgi:hypothetical protein